MPEKFNFTKDALERLPIPPAVEGKDVRVTYYDTKSRGLGLRVTDVGAKSFIFYRKVAGRPRRKFLGTFPEMTIEQARGKAARLNGEIADGENPFDAERIAREEVTFGYLFAQYMERHAKKTKKTWAAMIADFNRDLFPLINRRAASITRAEIERFHARLGEERGKYTANRRIQLGRAIFNKARLWGLFAGDNPFSGITLFKEAPRQKFLSDDEAAKLLCAIADPTTPDDTRDFVLLALFLAPRKSNLLAMRWDQLDLDAETWTIPDTKNGTSQVIKLGKNELQILKSRQERVNGDFVFPGYGKTGHLTDLKHSWATLRNRAEVPWCTIHDLRRSLAAGMARSNINLSLVKGAMNHADLKTTMTVYALSEKDAERDARTQVTDKWMQKAGLAPEPEEPAGNVVPFERVS